MENVLNIDFNGEPDEVQKIGYYFKSNNENYLVNVNVVQEGTNTVVTIYETELPQKDGLVLDIENGIPIAAMNSKYFCEIDLWPKHYHPKFQAEYYQWYYDVKETSPYKWEMNKNGTANKIKSVAEVMEFAVELGVKIGKIELR